MATNEGYSVDKVDPATLDFKSIGIPVWKVKVSIGLIYDFNSITDLRRYLEERKITLYDYISHDRKVWTRIGDIKDLDEHFRFVWKESKKAFEARDVSVRVTEPRNAIK